MSFSCVSLALGLFQPHAHVVMLEPELVLPSLFVVTNTTVWLHFLLIQSIKCILMKRVHLSIKKVKKKFKKGNQNWQNGKQL